MKRKKIDPTKLRDMVRSILPSRYRAWPRLAKAIRKRAHRRTVREELRLESPEATAVDFLRDVYVKDIVRDRRSGDKLNHFMRWCEAITKGMTKQEALQYVRAILPTGVIGDHAYGHWEIHVKYWRRDDVPLRRKPGASDRETAITRLRNALEIDPSLHARLNAEIKGKSPLGAPRRMLLGIHDVESFIDEMGWRERDVMDRLIAEIEEGGREAALRVSAPYFAAASENSTDVISSRTFFPQLFGTLSMAW